MQPQILHFLVHDGQADYRLTLPGVQPFGARVFQVVLYSPSNASIVSTAIETSVPSALATNFGAFVQQISPASFWIAPQYARALGPGRTPGVGKTLMQAQMGKLPIRFADASVVLSEFVQLSPSDALTESDVANVDSALAKTQRLESGFGGARQSCTRTIGEGMHQALQGELRVGSTWQALADRIDSVLVHKVSCETPPTLSAAEIDSVRARYQAAVAAPAPLQVTGSATIANAPLVHFRFMAFVGALVGQMYGGDQVTPNTTSKLYDANRVSRGMTMAAVAYSPVAFDSTSTAMSWAERFSVIAGPLLTPAAGVAGGISIGLIRGFALSGGMAWLVLGRGPDGQQAGDPLPATGRVLTSGLSRSWFLGGNYVFGK